MDNKLERLEIYAYQVSDKEIKLEIIFNYHEHLIKAETINIRRTKGSISVPKKSFISSNFAEKLINKDFIDKIYIDENCEPSSIFKGPILIKGSLKKIKNELNKRVKDYEKQHSL